MRKYFLCNFFQVHNNQSMHLRTIFTELFVLLGWGLPQLARAGLLVAG